MSTTERRKAKRRGILEKFSFYLCIPKLGHARHKINDVSELGIGFTLNSLNGAFKLEAHEKCEMQFYLNQSLYLALNVEVVRQEESEQQQIIGAVFLDTSSNQYQTLLTLVKFLDQLSDFAQPA